MATVVRVDGSSYRRPGARMLIQADGQFLGLVSGGCLERHVVQRAFWLTREGAALRCYQTGEGADSQVLPASGESGQWESSQAASDQLTGELEDQLDTAETDAIAFGLGCNGAVHVLFERLDSPSVQRRLNAIQQALLQRQQQVHAIICQSTHPALPVGHTLLASDLSDHVALQILWKQAAQSGQSAYVAITLDQHEVELFIEVITPPSRLIICGAGVDVIPLVGMAKWQGWQVWVIDSRITHAQPARFPQADRVWHLPLAQAHALLPHCAGAAIAIMSHSLTQDRTWLRLALDSDAAYIGQLGPRYRTERLLSDIGEQHADRLHYPIGLKMAGDTPEAIALSIVAQISQVQLV